MPASRAVSTVTCCRIRAPGSTPSRGCGRVCAAACAVAAPGGGVFAVVGRAIAAGGVAARAAGVAGAEAVAGCPAAGICARSATRAPVRCAGSNAAAAAAATSATCSAFAPGCAWGEGALADGAPLATSHAGCPVGCACLRDDARCLVQSVAWPAATLPDLPASVDRDVFCTAASHASGSAGGWPRGTFTDAAPESEALTDGLVFTAFPRSD